MCDEVWVSERLLWQLCEEWAEGLRLVTRRSLKPTLHFRSDAGGLHQDRNSKYNEKEIESRHISGIESQGLDNSFSRRVRKESKVTHGFLALTAGCSADWQRQNNRLLWWKPEWTQIRRPGFRPRPRPQHSLSPSGLALHCKTKAPHQWSLCSLPVFEYVIISLQWEGVEPDAEMSRFSFHRTWEFRVKGI